MRLWIAALLLSTLVSAGDGFVELGFDVYKGTNKNDALRGKRELTKEDLEATLKNEKSFYTANVSIGTPAQNMHILIDTGSSDIWVTGADTPQCKANGGSLDCAIFGVFDDSKSSTFKDDESTAEPFRIDYGDGTYAKGSWSKETVGLSPSLSVEDVTFALANDTDSHVAVFGIGYESNESRDQKYQNFPMLMKSQGLINKIAYSVYLNSPDADSGNILFGAIDHAKYQGDLVAIPVVKNDGRQRLDIALNEIWIDLNGDESLSSSASASSSLSTSASSSSDVGSSTSSEESSSSTTLEVSSSSTSLEESSSSIVESSSQSSSTVSSSVVISFTPSSSTFVSSTSLVTSDSSSIVETTSESIESTESSTESTLELTIETVEPSSETTGDPETAIESTTSSRSSPVFHLSIPSFVIPTLTFLVPTLRASVGLPTTLQTSLFRIEPTDLIYVPDFSLVTITYTETTSTFTTAMVTVSSVTTLPDVTVTVTNGFVKAKRDSEAETTLVEPTETSIQPVAKRANHANGVDTGNSPALLDTGSSYSYMPQEILGKLLGVLGNGTYFQESVGSYIVPCSIKDKNHNLGFNFNNQKDITIPLNQFIVNFQSQNECLFTILPGDYSFGDNLLRHVYAVFNLEDDTISLANAKYTNDRDIKLIA